MDIRKVDYSTFEVWPEMPEQAAVHTAEHPFCWDATCYCHTDAEAVQQLADDVRDGLASGADALRFEHAEDAL